VEKFGVEEKCPNQSYPSGNCQESNDFWNHEKYENDQKMSIGIKEKKVKTKLGGLQRFVVREI
jgi:hypothetical protein